MESSKASSTCPITQYCEIMFSGGANNVLRWSILLGGIVLTGKGIRLRVLRTQPVGEDVIETVKKQGPPGLAGV